MDFGTHRNPHGDELCAFAIGMRFDPEHVNAKVITFASPGEAKAYESQHKNITLVGIGGGEYDEHGKNSEECATTLIAKKLAVDTGLMIPLLEEVRKNDLKAKSHRTHIPEVIKAMYDYYPEKVVIEWGLKAYMTLVLACDSGMQIPESTDILEETCVDLSSRFQGNSTPTLRMAWIDCQAAVNNSRNALTQLRTVTDLIARAEGHDAARSWSAMGVETLFKRQLDFEKALDEVAKARQFVSLWRREISGGMTANGRYVGVALESDNPQLARAFRSNRAGNLDLALVRNKTGHVQIFSNAKSNIPMGECARAVRYAEARKRGFRVDFYRMDVDGDCKEVPQWHYFAKGGMVLNGSKSHPGIEVTRLDNMELLAIVENAFHPDDCHRTLTGGTIRKGQERIIPNPVLR